MTTTATASFTAPTAPTAPIHTALAGAPVRGAFDRGATGAPRLVLRLEAALVLAAALVAYAHMGGSWGWFAALFLVPDLSMLGYLAGPRVGAAMYNAGHSYVVPALLAGAALALGAPHLLLAACIWLGHIGFDRMLGYGLKYGTAFGDTHLGRVGKAA